MFCDLNNAGWMKKQGRQRGKACLTSNIFQSYQIEGDVVGLPSKGVKMKPHYQFVCMQFLFSFTQQFQT